MNDDDKFFHSILYELISYSNSCCCNSIANDSKNLIVLYNKTKSNEIRDFDWTTSIIYSSNDTTNDNTSYNIYNIIFILIKKYWSILLSSSTTLINSSSSITNDAISSNEKLLMGIWIAILAFPEYDHDYAVNTSSSILNNTFVDLLFQRYTYTNNTNTTTTNATTTRMLCGYHYYHQCCLHWLCKNVSSLRGDNTNICTLVLIFVLIIILLRLYKKRYWQYYA